MNSNNPQKLIINFPVLRFWLTAIAVIWLLGALGLGWLVQSFFVLLSLLLITPVIAVLVFRWWLQRNLVQAQCPVCDYELAGLNNSQTRCPNCGEPLKVENRQFQRLTPPGTIDVQAVDVSAQVVDDAP